MLPADHRLRAGEAFRETVRTGRRAGTGALVVHFRAVDRAGNAETPTRVGFVVGRAVGGAVARNRLRRRLRHLVRDQLRRLPPSAEIVVRALPPAADLPSAELGIELSRCLDRLSAMRLSR